MYFIDNINIDYINEEQLFLQEGFNNNIQLCITSHWDTHCIHLTSTDDNYREWLKKHSNSLMILSKECWYVNDANCNFYSEFHVILQNLMKMYESAKSII